MIPDGPKPLIDKATKTYYKGQMIVKIPLSSGGGHFYFTKTNRLEVQFIRVISADDNMNTPFSGYYEFIDMNTFSYKRISFKGGLINSVVSSSSKEKGSVRNLTMRSNSWLGQLLWCIGHYIAAVPAKDAAGEWTGCWVLGGEGQSSSPGVNQNINPGDSGSSIFDLISWFLTNPPIDYNLPQGPNNPWQYYDGNAGYYDPSNSYLYNFPNQFEDPNNIGFYQDALDVDEQPSPPAPFIWNNNADDGSTYSDINPTVEPNFKFEIADNYEILYPRFTNMVKNLKSFVKNHQKVMSALQAYSGLSKQQILTNLTFGIGPTIKLAEYKPGKFGQFYIKQSIKIVSINALYVRGLEAAVLSSTQEATAFLLGVTLLHELVHFGTTKNNKSEGIYDFGFGFERDAFNVIVDDDNAGNIVINFRKYF